MEIVKIGAMWCPACIITNKFWNDIISDFKDINFSNLDIDLDEEEASKYNDLDILPVIIMKKNDKEVARIIGEHSKEEIEKKIKEVLDNEKK